MISVYAFCGKKRLNSNQCGAFIVWLGARSSERRPYSDWETLYEEFRSG